MGAKLPEQLLDDSEAALRLVDTLLDDLRTGEAEAGAIDLQQVAEHLGSAPANLAALPAVLIRTYNEITGALDTLRRSRGVLERTTVERVQRTHERLREVTSATEMAATDMLDGLDRAIALVNHLDTAVDPDARAAMRDELREELFRLMGCLQFQDITAQQLDYASSVLSDVEERLDAVTRLFDLSALGDEGASPKSETRFDPHASTLDVESRQALADEIFPGTTPDTAR